MGKIPSPSPRTRNHWNLNSSYLASSELVAAPKQLWLDMLLLFDFNHLPCAKSSNPTRDLLRSSHRKNPFGSACAVCPRINRFAMDRTRRPRTKKAAKPTSTTKKATGRKLNNLPGSKPGQKRSIPVFFPFQSRISCWAACSLRESCKRSVWLKFSGSKHHVRIGFFAAVSANDAGARASHLPHITGQESFRYASRSPLHRRERSGREIQLLRDAFHSDCLHDDLSHERRRQARRHER